MVTNYLPMDLTVMLVFVHVLAAIVWIGGALTGVLLGTRLRAIGSVDAFAKFCEAFAQVAGPLFGGSALVVLGTGVWLVIDSPGLEFSATWISIGFAGWLVSMVMGATVVGMSWTKLGHELAEPGASLEEATPRIARAVRLTWIDLAIRIAVVLVMVWRPV